MFSLSVQADIKAVQKKLNATERQVIPTAASRAMNRTRDNGRTRLVRGLQTHLGMSNQKAIRRRLLRRFTKGATRSRLVSRFSFGTYQMAVGDFFPSAQSGAGVTVSGRKSWSFSPAFIATMPKSGYTGPFERFGAKTRVISQSTGRARRTQRIRKPTADISRPVTVIGKRSMQLALRHVWPVRFEFEIRRELAKVWRR